MRDIYWGRKPNVVNWCGKVGCTNEGKHIRNFAGRYLLYCDVHKDGKHSKQQTIIYK
jgi:hypothetical protein